MAADKDTIYVDVDDEITTIIDKVRGSDGKVIALVLPKRATVFQSIVNMKLLKRAAESAKKHLVLVTTEANLMPLAGTVGLHVAATPQSKPEVPMATPATSDEISMDEPVDDSAYTADNAGDEPVGELAKRTGHVMGGEAETVALDDEAADDEDEEPDVAKRDHRLHVPNFNKFRLRLMLGILVVIALVAGFYVANVVLPKAVIAITTNSSSVNVSISPTLDTAATALDTTKLIVPAKSEQQKETPSVQVDATGQKNNGDTATGTVTLNATECFPHIGFPDTVAAGVGLSTNGLTFITQEDATFHPNGTDGVGCNYYKAENVDITAQSGGAKYNVSGVDFTVAGRSDVSAHGSASGGTDNVVTVVSQDDIDGAKKKLGTQDTATIQSALADQLRTDGMYPLAATFTSSKPVVTTDKNVGDQAANVTVTETITYTMYGVKQSDLDALIKANVDSQVDTKNQSITNDGLDQATITVSGTTKTQVQLSLRTTATVGPNLNVATIKQQAAGKQIGDVKSMLNQVQGVESVDVSLSPFWVSVVPSNPNQVVVTIDKK